MTHKDIDFNLNGHTSPLFIDLNCLILLIFLEPQISPHFHQLFPAHQPGDRLSVKNTDLRVVAVIFRPVLRIRLPGLGKPHPRGMHGFNTGKNHSWLIPVTSRFNSFTRFKSRVCASTFSVFGVTRSVKTSVKCIQERYALHPVAFTRSRYASAATFVSPSRWIKGSPTP